MSFDNRLTSGVSYIGSRAVTPGICVWTWEGSARTRTSRFKSSNRRPRRRLDTFSARFRFARLGCLAAQIALLSFGGSKTNNKEKQKSTTRKHAFYGIWHW